MSASIDNDGCLVWPGKVGILGNGYSEPEVNKLRVGRIAFQPHINLFKIYTGNGRNEKPETSFRVNEVKNVAVYGMKDTVCIFQLIQQNGKEKHFHVAIDFKGSRDPGNQLTPNEKAKSFREFLLKLTNGVKAPLFGSKPSQPSSSPMALKKILSSTRSFTHPMLKQKKEVFFEAQDEADDSFDSIAQRRLEAESASTSKPRIKTKQAMYASRSKAVDDDIPAKRQRLSAPEKETTTSIYDSLRSRNASGFSKFSSRQRGSPSGLANMGNTCYMNSILQATFIIENFSKQLFESLKFFKKEALNSESFIKRYLPLMEALSNLLNNRCTGNSLTVFLKSVLGCVSAAADKFTNNRQEDAHEFLTALLEQLQQEFNKAVERLNERRPPLLQSSDPIKECFGYTIRRVLTCSQCHHQRSVEEENTHFILTMCHERLKSGNFTFLDLVRDAMAAEVLDFDCSECDAKEALVTKEIIKLPEHFIFMIKRYTYNPNNGHKQKIHAKVEMYKHLTFFTSAELSHPQNLETQIKTAANGADKNAATSKGGRKKRNIIPRGINNRWRDRKINSSKMGYLIEDLDDEEYLNNAFDNLYKWCKDNVEGKGKVTSCNTVSDEPNEYAYELLYALSGGNEALYVRLREMIYDLLATNADLYASMVGKSEKAFKDFVKNKARKNDLSPTNLELHACAALFECVIVVKEAEKWISYIPKFVKLDDIRKIVTHNHFHRKRIFLPANSNYLASILHTKRARSYSLSSVVCHVGHSTEGGHYKCAVQTATGWSMCNDDVITNCHEKTVLDKSADSGYILFYSMCKDRSPSPKRERAENEQQEE